MVLIAKWFDLIFHRWKSRDMQVCMRQLYHYLQTVLLFNGVQILECGINQLDFIGSRYRHYE